MTYNAKLTSLHKGLTPIYPDQDRINFAPKLAEDISILMEDGTQFYMNKVYTASDADFPELAGTIWVISDIEGWWNLAEPQMPAIERGFGDGMFDMSGRLTARDLTLSGSVIIESGTNTTIAAKSILVRNQILSAFNLVKRGAWMIVDEDRATTDYGRAAYVRLVGRPQISTVNSRGRIDFQVGLRAADPIKYEWSYDAANSTSPYGETNLGNGYRYSIIASNVAGSRFYDEQSSMVDFRLGEAVLIPSDPIYTNDGYTFRSYGESGSIDYRLDETDSGDGYIVRTYGEQDATSLVSTGLASTTPATLGYGSIINHGDANVYPYFRVIGALYGPAVIKNLTTGAEMNFVVGTDGGYLLSDNSQYVDIDVRIREMHAGSYYGGENTESARAMLEPLTDWIYLAPGVNEIFFEDFGASSGSATSRPFLQIFWRSGWIG